MFTGAVSRLQPPPGGLPDAALAWAVFALVGLGSLHSVIGERQEPWAVTGLGWVMIAAACGALAWRRRWPVPVCAFVLVTTKAYYLVSFYDGPLMAAYVVSLYAVAAEGRLRAAVVLGLLSLFGVSLGTLAGNSDVNSIALFMLTGWLVGMVSLGWAQHTRLAYTREAERRAADEERLRIAREVHDVVGHQLSLINVQSAAALRRLRKDPAADNAAADAATQQAASALEAIKESSRESLRELRATLGMLRRDDEQAPTSPAADLTRITELAASAELAGLEVRTHITGEGRALPAPVQLAAYRIVQESLTNVTRHAGATMATVHVDCAPDEVTVEVADNGHGTAAHTGGHGIIGMRERVRALGGEISAGPGPGGGFVVRARLPRAVRP
jgi:signal transduction histidine kinase